MFLGCETHTLSYLLFTYVYSTTLVELQKSTISKLQNAYHNVFIMFLVMSKYESTSYLCTFLDIQSVIRKLVYGFICRLASSVNYIIKGSYQFAVYIQDM